MSPRVRCENLMTGLVALDLFRLLSDREASRRGLPKGSLWLAPQTHDNLKYVAKGMLCLLVSKEPIGNFWLSGHGRLSELPIEEFFGRLRARALNAQMSVRSYFKSSAKEMVRTLRANNREKDPGASNMQIVKPVSAADFLACSTSALNAATKLAGWCADVDDKSLLNAYQMSPEELLQDEPLHQWENDWNGHSDDVEELHEPTCQEVLNCVAEDAKDVTEEANGMDPSGEDQGDIT